MNTQFRYGERRLVFYDKGFPFLESLIDQEETLKYLFSELIVSLVDFDVSLNHRHFTILTINP